MKELLSYSCLSRHIIHNKCSKRSSPESKNASTRLITDCRTVSKVIWTVSNGLTYINTLDLIDEIGIDFDTDTYNRGQGLNVFGAEKLSIFLGNYLRENSGIADHRADPEISAVWERISRAYYDMKKAQIAEFESYGEIKTFTYKP